jgi:hypothetical protein
MGHGLFGGGMFTMYSAISNKIPGKTKKWSSIYLGQIG